MPFIVPERDSVDISEDTNLAVTAPITLTGDTIGFQDPITVDLTFDGASLVNPDYIDFNTSYVPESQEGRMYWDDDNGTVSVGMPGGEVVGQIFLESLRRVTNKTGDPLLNGRLVYVTGSQGNRLTVDYADNTDPDKSFILGMLTENIADNGSGYVALSGDVRGSEDQPINTSTCVEGSKLYLGTEGNFTSTHPSGATTAVVLIGRVASSHITDGIVAVDRPESFTIGNDFDGTMRQSIINKSTGTSAASGFTAVNDNGHFATFGIAGSGNTGFPNEVSVMYGPGYGDHWQAVDGNKDFVWFTDPTDSHNNSSLNNEVMRLTAAGILKTNSLEIADEDGNFDNIFHADSYILNGLSEDKQDLYVVVDGGEVYLEVEKIGGGDMEYVFNETVSTLDCTTGSGTDGRARVLLTQGLSDDPQMNYVYVTNSSGTATIAASTSFPSGTIGMIASVAIGDDVRTGTDGPAHLQRWTMSLKHDNADASTGDVPGTLYWMQRKLRVLGAVYKSGIELTTDDTAGVIDLTAGGGVVYQLHPNTWPSRQISADGIYVANASGLGTLSVYEKLTDLADVAELADGTSITNNRYFSVTVWGSMNSSDQNGNQSKLYFNLPSNFYLSSDGAIADENNYDVRTVPDEFSTTAFLIGRLTMQRQAGGNVFIGNEVYSLLGQSLGSRGGGTGSTVSNSFSDAQFNVFDDTDPTKVLNLEISGVTTGTTRTLTIPDGDGTLLLAGGLSGGQSVYGGTATGELLSLYDNTTDLNKLTIEHVSGNGNLRFQGKGGGAVAIHSGSTTDYVDLALVRGPLDGTYEVGGFLASAGAAANFSSLSTAGDMILTSWSGDMIYSARGAGYAHYWSSGNPDSLIMGLDGSGNLDLVTGSLYFKTDANVFMRKTTTSSITGGVYDSLEANATNIELFSDGLINIRKEGTKSIGFYSDSTIIGQINSSENWGIGGAPEGTACKMHVKGGANALAFKVSGSNPDGVRASIFPDDADRYAAFYAYDENDGGTGAYVPTWIGHAATQSNAAIFDPVNKTIGAFLSGAAESTLHINGGILGDHPTIHLNKTSVQNVGGAEGTLTQITWQTQTEIDTDQFTHSTSTNPSRIYVDNDGKYSIQTTVNSENTGAGRVDISLYFRKNGSGGILTGRGGNYSRGSAYNEDLRVSAYTEIDLSAGDYIEIQTRVEHTDATYTVNTIVAECQAIIKRLS